MKKWSLYLVLTVSLVAFLAACGPRSVVRNAPSPGKIMKTVPKPMIPFTP